MHDVWPHLRSSSERGAVRCVAAERELQFSARCTVLCSMHGMEFLQTYTFTIKLANPNGPNVRGR